MAKSILRKLASAAIVAAIGCGVGACLSTALHEFATYAVVAVTSVAFVEWLNA